MALVQKLMNPINIQNLFAAESSLYFSFYCLMNILVQLLSMNLDSLSSIFILGYTGTSLLEKIFFVLLPLHTDFFFLFVALVSLEPGPWT